MTKPEIEITREDLQQAFVNQELELYYQPQFNLQTSEFEGVEALIRWNRQDGQLLPADFLPVVEAEGMIAELGEWVLDVACMQHRAWIDKGVNPVRMAVNVYSGHFKERAFVDYVIRTIKKYRLRPSMIELELTENMVIHADDEDIHENIRRLRARGVTIALDDFGTGFSSISHLKKIHVDRIKIDKSYIEHIHINSDDAAIVQAIISLASGLNLRSLAEGVESHHQLKVLMDYECHEAQGFYFSEPLTAEETEAFLRLYQDNPFTFNHPG